MSVLLCRTESSAQAVFVWRWDGEKPITTTSTITRFRSDIVAGTAAGQTFDPMTLPQVGYHAGGIAYWDTPYFANAMYNGSRWMEYAPDEWSTGFDLWINPQFDANGFPQYLNPGKRLRAICYALHANCAGSRPATWPRRSGPAKGHVAVVWRGHADFRLTTGKNGSLIWNAKVVRTGVDDESTDRP